MLPNLAQTLIRILLILVHLAGLVVAVLLLVRRRGIAPILAATAFTLLILLDAARIVQTALLPSIVRQIRSPHALPWVVGSLNCCCGFLDLVAWGCLIAALWLGMGRSEAEHEIRTEKEETSLPSE